MYDSAKVDRYSRKFFSYFAVPATAMALSHLSDKRKSFFNPYQRANEPRYDIDRLYEEHKQRINSSSKKELMAKSSGRRSPKYMRKNVRARTPPSPTPVRVRNNLRTIDPPPPTPASPAFIRRMQVAGRRYLIRKSKRTSGATNSKSRGFIKGGTKRLSPEDYFAKRGVIVHREFGKVVSTTAVEAAQSVVIGHSTYGKTQLLHDLASALVKMMALKLGRDIKSFGDSQFNSSAGTPEHAWVIEYGQSPNAGFATFQLTCTPGLNASWESVRDGILTHLISQTGSQTGYWISKFWLQMRDSNGASPAYYPVVDLDMSKAVIEIYSKSSMKVQNRTVNTSGNQQADDVDNVPMFGKSYYGTGNYIMVQNAGYATVSSQTQPPNIDFKSGAGLNSQLREPLPKSMVGRAKVVGKVHLDPGEIKTSVLVHRKKYSFNSLLRSLAIIGTEGTNTNFFNIGKFRFIHLEKMLQAVATTDVNAFNVAYEVDCKSGVYITAPKFRTTNYIEYLSPA